MARLVIFSVWDQYYLECNFNSLSRVVGKSLFKPDTLDDMFSNDYQFNIDTSPLDTFDHITKVNLKNIEGHYIKNVRT